MDIVDVAIGVLMRETGEQRQVLITRRPEGRVYAGYWEMPGGKCEPGESPAACLQREFAEEVGLTVNVGNPIATVEHRYDHAHVRLHAFWCAVPTGHGHEARNLEVAEHRWVTAAELARYEFPEANRTITQRVCAALTG